MHTLQNLIDQAAKASLASYRQLNTEGEEVDGGAEAHTVEYTFSDGEIVTVGGDVLRDEDFKLVKFQA